MMIKEKRGLTLIALIITLIILLIIFGATIYTLTGENGLINRTIHAQEENKRTMGFEEIQQAIISSYDKEGIINQKKLAKNLSRIDGIRDINNNVITSSTIIDLPTTVLLNGFEYEIPANESDSIENPSLIKAAKVQKAPEIYYGKYVTYTSQNDAGINAPENQKWQIFMADNDNIYLISNNFVTRKYIGEINEKKYNYDEENDHPDTATKMWFDNILGQYTVGPETSDIPNLLSKFDNKTRTTYHKWMNTEANQIKKYNNEKVVASLLDVDNIWSGYNNTTYANYAIGGPTIEMFCKAYNDTHTGDKIEAVETNEENDYGYRIKKGTADPSDTVEDLKTGAINTLVDGMYFKRTTEGSYYWIASPSANNPNRIVRIASNGHIGCLWHNNVNVGFLPIVCLKSKVHLVENNELENTYNIELDN